MNKRVQPWWLYSTNRVSEEPGTVQKINDSDRIFWILTRRLLNNWRDTLLIVKPETVIKWHRKGWKYF